MSIKKFRNENAEAQRQWMEANMVALKEEDLLLLHAELAKFGHVGTRRNLFRWLVHSGAASWIGEDRIAVAPGKYEIAMHKLSQWSKWRSRAYPFDAAKAFGAIGEKKAELAGEKNVVPHGTGGGEFEYPGDEINPDDIPF